MAVKLGSVVTDSVSGFSGTVTARSEYLFGCVRVYLEPNALHEGKPIEGQWFDEQRCGLSRSKVGGPGRVAPRKDAPPA